MTRQNADRRGFADDSEPFPARNIDRGIARRRKRILSALLSIIGATSLGYLAGATVMFFQAPSSLFISKGLLGARKWYDGERGFSTPRDLTSAPAVRTGVDQPERTFDGYTLYACEASEEKSGTQAFLINMRGETVHRWAVPFSRLWPNPSHLESRMPDSEVCIFACHLYPNGDLLAVFHRHLEPHGCGLAKLDKDSKVLWTYGALIHHDVHVTEDGTIYTLEHKFVDDLPKGLERIGTPTIIDWLLMLSPDGKLLREPISILAAFQDTPYALLLEGLKWPFNRHVWQGGSTAGAARIYEFGGHDPVHTNSVRVLDRNLATKFPLFKAGQVLLSIRNMNVLAVLDPDSGKIVWAARGPWFAQHDAQFLDNGHLLLYDNLGVAMGSRVLEYDLQTQAFPWFYGGPLGTEFFSTERGACQRLPNGNTLVVNSESGEMIEVGQDKEVVWSLFADNHVTTARRYTTEQLPFLEGQRARP